MAEDLNVLPDTTSRALRQAIHGFTPGVLIVCGFPAVGKSSAARMLAAEFDAPILDKDKFAPGLEESVMGELTGDPHDRDSMVYKRVVLPHLYEALVQTALLIGTRHSVVIDAPFLSYVRRAREEGVSLSNYMSSRSDHAVDVRTVWVSARPEVIRKRMARRGALRDRSKLGDWHAYRLDVLDSGIGCDAESVVDAVVLN